MNGSEYYKDIFKEVMNAEIGMRQITLYTDTLRVRYPYASAEYFYNAAWQILEIAKSAFVSRSYNQPYGLTRDNIVYESVSAHTNLASAIANHALYYVYGTGFGERNQQWIKTVDGFSYRTIMETIRLHDLAENETGDIADNGSRDEQIKAEIELKFLGKYIDKYPFDEKELKNDVSALLHDVAYYKDFYTGRLIYMADKVAALIVTLCLDSMGKSPLIEKDSPFVSERDKKEIKLCDFCTEDGRYRASEMWTTDFLTIRELNQYDDSFFFTGLVVMTTLIVHNRWYDWRYKQY